MRGWHTNTNTNTKNGATRDDLSSGWSVFRYGSAVFRAADGARVQNNNRNSTGYCGMTAVGWFRPTSSSKHVRHAAAVVVVVVDDGFRHLRIHPPNRPFVRLCRYDLCTCVVCTSCIYRCNSRAVNGCLSVAMCVCFLLCDVCMFNFFGSFGCAIFAIELTHTHSYARTSL